MRILSNRRNKDLTDNRPGREKGIQELVNRLALLKVSRNNPNNRSIVSVSTLQELVSWLRTRILFLAFFSVPSSGG